MSRYGSSYAPSYTGDATPPSAIPSIHARLRATFESEKTLPYAWRLSQLKAFLSLLRNGSERLQSAMKADLHKSAFESWATELSLCESEAMHAIAHLKSWMASTPTASSALNIPCWSYTRRDPLGVALVMGAWNYPAQLTLLPVVGAIAGGNCCVIKPGSYAVETSHAVCALVAEYMDPDAIVAVEGNRDVTSALLALKFDTIFFTGSGYVGKIIARAAAEHLTPCVLELGGKSPTIVDKSANLGHAARRIVWGTFVNSGQTCVRPDFLMVHESVAAALFEEIQRAIVQFYGDDPQQTEWFGRVINKKAFDRLKGLLDESREHLVVGGATDASERFISPAVFDLGRVDDDAFAKSGLMADEIFGPLLPAARFSTIDEAIGVVKRLPTGKPLALYLYASDAGVIESVKTRTTSGALVINDNLMHLANHELPFGGVGDSGMGAYHGVRSFNAFTHEKAVLEKVAWIDESFLLKPLLDARFPPYTSLKMGLVRAFSLPIATKLFNLPARVARIALKALLAYVVLRILGFRITYEG